MIHAHTLVPCTNHTKHTSGTPLGKHRGARTPRVVLGHRPTPASLQFTVALKLPVHALSVHMLQPAIPPVGAVIAQPHRWHACSLGADNTAAEYCLQGCTASSQVVHCPMQHKARLQELLRIKAPQYERCVGSLWPRRCSTRIITVTA